MNVCTFTGYLADDPVVSRVGDVSLAEFTVVVYNYRRTKSTGEKSRIPSYLDCEAWHTGAKTLSVYARRGDKITINATAKNRSREDKSIVFRVNEFDICSNGDYEEHNA